jgi:hypothetical protein
MTMLDGVRVIIVPDEDEQAKNVPPSVLANLGRENVLMSNDSRRMYVREALWQKMKDSFIPVIA